MWAVIADLPSFDGEGKLLGYQRVLDHVGDMVSALERANRRMASGIVATIWPLNAEIEDRFPRLPCAGVIDSLLAKKRLTRVDWPACFRNRVGVN